jgi:hypothetical protein
VRARKRRRDNLSNVRLSPTQLKTFFWFKSLLLFQGTHETMEERTKKGGPSVQSTTAKVNWIPSYKINKQKEKRAKRENRHKDMPMGPKWQHTLENHAIAVSRWISQIQKMTLMHFSVSDTSL